MTDLGSRGLRAGPLWLEPAAGERQGGMPPFAFSLTRLAKPVCGSTASWVRGTGGPPGPLGGRVPSRLAQQPHGRRRP